MHQKRIYLKPIVEVVEIDNSISLAMASDTEIIVPNPTMAQPTQEKNPFDSNAFNSTPVKKK